MASEWRGGIAPHHARSTSHAALDADRHARGRLANGSGQPSPASLASPAVTSPSSRAPGRDGFAVPAVPASSQYSRASFAAIVNNNNEDAPSSQRHDSQSSTGINDSADSSSQSLPLSAMNSQESTMTDVTNVAETPPAADAGVENGVEERHTPTDPRGQLLQLSAVAAAQDRIVGDADGGGARKRMADGEVKARPGSMSPIKGHSRNTSAISVASTTGSNIGELSAELRTRLSYAMVKVNNGWQTRSLDEVESLASQAVSPASSTSTIHRRGGSSASPRMPISSITAQVHFAHDPVSRRRNSNSPPSSSNRPALAPPASIKPAAATRMAHPRRNSNPRYTPTLLSQTHSQSHASHSPGESMRIDTNQPRPRSTADALLYSPHQNIREQDAIQTLLFMSSPGNSANLKHSFSPHGSPGPQSGSEVTSSGRHALPGAPRRALPSQRTALPNKKVALDRSPGMPPPPASPMEVDSPHGYSRSPNRGMPRRRINGQTNHFRGALSLPSGLGMGNGIARRVLRDEDIERMLDRAGAETNDSSDDEEIQLPPRRSGVAGVMGA